MNNNWQFTRRRLQNSWRAWRAEHLTRGKIAVFVTTVIIFILAVPVLIFLALTSDSSQLTIPNVTLLPRGSNVIVYGVDAALDLVTLRAQINLQLPLLQTAFDRQQINSLILSSPRALENPANLEITTQTLGVLPNVGGVWDFCFALKNVAARDIVVVADSLDVPKIAFVCKNFGLDIKLLAIDLYPAVARGGLWLRSLGEMVSLVWQVNSSTISLYEE